ncbi:MAG: sugar phosphate isomerase/epimerase [Gemmatimonadetes bacterium]|nr:sugar phosphate isomerase/epimerase [Gemmatimonadota bacterium]
MRLNFTVYGSQYTYGWLPEGAELVGAADFLHEARRRGFRGAELSHRMLEGLDRDELKRLRAEAEREGMELIVSTFGTDPELLRAQIVHAVALGASVVRTVVGGADYGGDRRAYAGGKWRQFMETVRDRFAAVMPEAERGKVSLAVEDHQDVSSEDLLWLCRHFESPQFGVVLDVANPLAVVEHPVDFALAVMPYVKYVHLKDYVLYWSAEGYRLVRCPVGGGAVPLAEIISELERHGRAHSASLELAALEARHVRCFADDFWPEYPLRSAAQVAKVLRLVREHARPASEDYRTPFEKGAGRERIVAYEESELRESIRLVAELTGDHGPFEALEAADLAGAVRRDA